VKADAQLITLSLQIFEELVELPVEVCHRVILSG
jgi:hypothetical protein